MRVHFDVRHDGDHLLEQTHDTLYHVIYTYATYKYVFVLYDVFNLLHSLLPLCFKIVQHV